MIRNAALVLSLVAAVVFGTGCGDDKTTAPQTTANLRVLHASPDAPAVDVLVDGQVVASNVPFQAFSQYLPVTAGTRNIKVRATATPSLVVIDVSPTLTAGTDYTVIARNRVASIEPWLLVDDNAAPASGQVKLRLIHAAPGAPTVDIFVTAPGASLATAEPTLSDVPYAAASGYLTVPAGTYQVRICPANTTTVAIDSGALTLTAGQIRTAVAVDQPSGGAPFGAVLMNDRN